MFISVIVPVYNGGETFRHCLAALSKSAYKQWECIIVDDGSADNSIAIAESYGAKIVKNMPPRSGPARARNIGAQAAQGDILFFIDADIRVRPDTVGQVATIMQTTPSLAACFGSYDDSPTEANFLSQYRNLQHHYVHQISSAEATTFWSGCGAIRRHIFAEMGGFNATAYPRPSIEDIELGYRLKAAGYDIHLKASLQVQHMKRWTARTLLVTDIRDRAIPWTRLILRQRALLNDLNLQTNQRISAATAFLGMAAIAASVISPRLLPLAGLAVATLLTLNRDFYKFLTHKRGIRFTLLALPWHWLYFLYSGFCFGVCLLWYQFFKFRPPVPAYVSSSSSPKDFNSLASSNKRI
jgi:glycosyltransferase involved in cell wall biosynthesis